MLHSLAASRGYGQAGNNYMDDLEIRRLQEEEKTYWWHVSRRAILQSVLVRHAEFISASPVEILKRVQDDGGAQARMTRGEKPRILDVGCGTGGNLTWLSKFGKVTGIDSSEEAVNIANSAMNHLSPPPLGGGVRGGVLLGRAPAFDPNSRVRQGRAEDLPVENGEFDLVTAFDVLEHLSDEARSLGEWGRVLSTGGLLLISVPAYQSLFGPHDRALEHLRRYDLPQLKKILQNNDFTIVFASYFFCLTFPLFWFQRILAKKSSHTSVQYVAVPKLINSLLIGLGKIESWWLSFAKFPFGSSIIVLAKKQ